MGEIVHPNFGAARRVTLAREGGFTVGRLTVQPSTLQLSFGNLRQTLEPRVMQVLVALARADGEVVSKDELLQSCWDGRIVGEDAINRVISRLRHIGQDIGGDTFHIETIRSVGYRLVEGEPSTMAGDHLRQIPGGGPLKTSRRTLLLASAAVAAAAVGGAAWLIGRTAGQPDPLALQYYQQGVSTRGQNSIELTKRGVALFRQATRIDPQFADAWGALAWNYRELAESGASSEAEPLRALATSAAARALELDAENGDAQAALLLLRPYYRNWEEIEAGCRRLLERHPGHGELEYCLAVNLTQVGRWREAIPFFQSASVRQPFRILPHLDWTHAMAFSGRLEEAADLIDDGMRRFPGHAGYWVTKLRFLAVTGQAQEALDFASDPSKLPAGATMLSPEIQLEIALVRALAERSQGARDAAIRRFTDIARAFPARTGASATALCLIGQLDLGFSMFEGYFLGTGSWKRGVSFRAFTSRLFGLPDPNFLQDPRFLNLLRRTGLEDYWRVTGTAPDYRRYRLPEYRLPVG